MKSTRRKRTAEHGRRVRIADIAEAAGVSSFTVSAALRGDVQVAAATRGRISQLAKKMGYERNAAAAMLAGQRWRERGAGAGQPKVGVISTSETWSWEPPDTRGFLFERLEVPAAGQWRATLRTWWHRGFDGLIFDMRGSPGLRRALDEAARGGAELDRFAVVTVGPSVFSCVRDSPVDMMGEALDRVAEAGYKRIAVLLFESEQKDDDRARLGAVLVFREERGGRAELAHRILPAWTGQLPEDVTAWLREWRPEVVVGFPGGLHWRLQDAGFRMPDDFAFCGLPVSTELRLPGGVIAGLLSDFRVFDGSAVELMEQLLRLGLRGIPKHPLMRVIPNDWRDGKTMPPASRRQS